MANRQEDSSLKSMASGPLKIEKGTFPVLILASHRHTTESVEVCSIAQNDTLPVVDVFLFPMA